MYQWIESIRIENGEPQNLHWHQKRMDATFMQFSGKKCPFSLVGVFLDNPIPLLGVHKARIVYSLDEINEFATAPYSIKTIEHFKLVEQNELDYAYKYLDRSSLDELKTSSAEPIITQHGLITDTSYSNLLFLQNDCWHTPSTFLLNGVMRQKLLAENKIQEKEIRISDLGAYSHFKMINAMMPIDEAISYPINIIGR